MVENAGLDQKNHHSYTTRTRSTQTRPPGHGLADERTSADCGEEFARDGEAVIAPAVR